MVGVWLVLKSLVDIDMYLKDDLIKMFKNKRKYQCRMSLLKWNIK